MRDEVTQIKVLLGSRGLAYDYACQTLDVDNMMHHSYGDVFTVSEADVYEYILENNLPESEDTSKNSLKKGFHYYEEDGKCHTFFREKTLHLMRKALKIESNRRNILQAG